VLTQYDVDVERAVLVKRSSITLPGNLGEGWVHPSKRYLYVPWSDPTRTSDDRFGVSAFRIDPSSGVLSPAGDPLRLRSSASNITADVPGEHLLIGNQTGIFVYRLGSDGAIGQPVEQTATFDVGIVQHQLRVTPSNDLVILVTRGHYTHEQYPNLDSPGPLKILEPGALKVYSYKDGRLTSRASIAEGGGYGFQARHIDFHPTRPWVFLTIEPQNKLYVYKDLKDTLSPHPIFTRDTLADPANVRPMQHAGTLHVHPSGNVLYVANRTNGTMDFEGRPVFGGGENSIAVYSINQETGEPTLIQHADTRGVLPRTFCVEPNGRMLVVANQTAFAVREAQSVRMLPSSLAVFRIAGDGKLDFARKYDYELAAKTMTWRSPQGFTVGETLSCVAMVPLK
jgi:6-phosphogluconolactonase (cycloisomerase 2 family)